MLYFNLMRLFLFFLIQLLSCLVGFSQKHLGIVLDATNERPLELVTILNVNNSKSCFSKSNGEFIIAGKKHDSLKISFVGYKTVKILFDGKEESIDTIYLYPETYSLDEVAIKNKKYAAPIKITAKKNNEKEEYFGFQFGTEHVNYIENVGGHAGKITSISFPLSKAAKYNPDIKEWKLDYISDFKISFYEYDRVNDKPGRLINIDSIIVSPGNKTQIYEVNLEKYNIDFPLDGVCVGVEVYNSKYKNPKTTFASIAPGIKFIKKTSIKKVESWVRFNKPNMKDEFKKTGINGRTKIRFYDSMSIDIKVKFEK